MLLVGRNELVEEAYIVLREHTQVGYTILQVSDTLDAKTESVAGVHLAIDAASLEHVRIYHTTTQNLYPASVLAETAALTATNVARDVHLCAWLCEGEVARTQTNLCVRTEELACESEKHLLQVGERHVFINVKTLKLMEEAVSAC